MTPAYNICTKILFLFPYFSPPEDEIINNVYKRNSPLKGRLVMKKQSFLLALFNMTGLEKVARASALLCEENGQSNYNGSTYGSFFFLIS
jgi:hypothetical protein